MLSKRGLASVMGLMVGAALLPQAARADDSGLVVAGPAPTATPSAPATVSLNSTVAVDKPEEPAKPFPIETGGGLGMGVFARSINVPTLTFSEVDGESIELETDLVAIGAGFRALFATGAWRAFFFQVSGGQTIVASGNFRPGPTSSLPRELESPTFVTIAAGTGGTFPIGPIDLVVEQETALDLLWIDVRSEEDNTVTNTLSSTAIGVGGRVGVRYSPSGCLFFESTYGAALEVATNGSVGYAHGANFNFGCDASLEHRQPPRSHY
jgi:hypothetical protein